MAPGPGAQGGGVGRIKLEGALLSDDQDCRAYCLTGKWHPAAGCCLTKKYTLDQLK